MKNKLEFIPILTKKEANKAVTKNIVVCKKCKEQYISVSSLNRCFGFKGHGGEAVRKAMGPCRVKGEKNGNAVFVKVADARKIVDFVYDHKAANCFKK